MFYESTFIPISYFHHSDQEIHLFPKEYHFLYKTRNMSDEFLTFSKSPDYFISNSFCYYGYIDIPSENSCVIIGPVFSTPVTNAVIRSFVQEWAISLEHKETIAEMLINIPNLSFLQFLNTLIYINFCFTGEKISAVRHFKLEDTSILPEVSSVHSKKMMDLKENQKHHNTYHFERKMLQYIQDGDVKKIKELLTDTKQLSEGIVADNALRQEKNIFISLATMVTRSAILGGMDIEQAYQLADVYIQECEKAQSISYISNLSYTMLIDFTQRVSANKMPGGISQEIFDCVQFITRYTNEPIQVNDVADYLGKSRSYLTKKFKSELGFDISSFIMRCKLEEAKSLLTYSEKSLSEISNYLCFSSQAYFQNVFKKKYGITPTQYRKMPCFKRPTPRTS